jgi:DNA-binding SARP family transcriptional activator
MLEIKLFGVGEIKYCGQHVVGFPNQAPYLLLCYLLLNRAHPHNRERLAAVFWSDASVANSRKMLRNTLWRLRHGMLTAGIPVDVYFHLEEDQICFMNAQPYWLDVEIFEKATLSFQDIPGQLLTISQVTDLESAAALYVGDLMEGVYDDWCLYDRERLRLILQSLLCKLMIFYGFSGSYDQAINYGIRLLAMDNTWEKIHRQLMLLYCMSGDRSSALAQYKQCQQILHEQVGVTPMPETRLLYEKMLHNRFDPHLWLEKESPLASSNDPSPKSASQIANRIQEELRRLKSMIEATRDESDLIEKLIDDVLNA